MAAPPAPADRARLRRRGPRLRRRNPDLIGGPRLWLALSAVTMVVAVAGIAVNGLNLSVESTGGRLMEYATSRPVPVDAARAAVADAGFPTAVVQASGDGVAVRTGQIGNDDQVAIAAALADVAGPTTLERDELIGPSLGSELRTKALIAFGVALFVQMLYLAARFRWVFGAAAVAAMFHDVVLGRQGRGGPGLLRRRDRHRGDGPGREPRRWSPTTTG